MSQHLLLATDLSARCDRAMDRSLQLAQQWGAELDVINVLEQPVAPEQLLGWMVSAEQGKDEDIVARAMEKEFVGCNLKGHMHIARGEPKDAIVRQANEIDASLVITGMARSETFGRFLLGSTVESMARSIKRPLLVVRNRVHGAYQRIMVSTDFSEASREVLVRAAQMFPEQELLLYHVVSLPLSGIGGEQSEKKVAQSIEQGEALAFLLNSGLTPEQRRWVRVVVEAGPLETQMARYVREQDIQLVILGSHGRTGLLNMLIGSAAARMLEWLPCDSMIIRRSAK